MELSQQQAGARAGATHRNYAAWVKYGVYGGIIAGITFALFEMIVAAIIAGNFFGPLRMIGAVALGPQALTPEVPLFNAAIVGLLVHMVYSIIAGIVFALIAALINPLSSSATVLIISASVYGLLMWLVNFYLIAPSAGWVWFPERASQFWQGFVAHTFLYGAVLGWYLGGVRHKAYEKEK